MISSAYQLTYDPAGCDAWGRPLPVEIISEEPITEP